jgi:hypothetical protein
MSLAALASTMPALAPLMRLSTALLTGYAALCTMRNAQSKFLEKQEKDFAEGKITVRKPPPTITYFAVARETLFTLPIAVMIILITLLNVWTANPSLARFLPYIKEYILIDLPFISASFPYFYFRILETRDNNPIVVSWKVRFKAMAAWATICPVIMFTLFHDLWRDVWH